MRDSALVFACIALGYSLQIEDGKYNPKALCWLSVAVVGVIVAIFPPKLHRLDRWGKQILTSLLFTGILVQLYLIRTWPPGIIGRPPSPQLELLFHCAVLAAVIAAGMAIARFPLKFWFPLMLASYAAVGVFMIKASIAKIDVIVVHKEGFNAFLNGISPYAITFQDIYGADSPFNIPGFSVNGRITYGFGYPPLSFLLALPGHLLFGDFRYSNLIAVVSSALLLLGAKPSTIGGLACFLLLFTPRSFYIIEMGWTESLVMFVFALTVFVAVRSPRFLPYTLGLLFMMKQYLILATPAVILLLPRPLEWGAVWRLLVKATAVAVVVNIPFLLWEPYHFVRTLLIVPLHHHFRMDALSYAALLARQAGHYLPSWVAVLTAGATLILCIQRVPRTPAGFAAAVGAVLLALFSLNGFAFCNYYYFVIGSFCSSVVVSGGGLGCSESISREAGA